MSSTDEFIFSVKGMALRSFQKFGALREKGNLCDITFCIENEKISAHRVVLAANIPYFEETFLESSSDNSEKRKVVEQIQLEAFKSLVDFAYTCEIKITAENVKSVLVGSSLLSMDEISDACVKFISRRLLPGDAVEIQKFATEHNFVKLKKTVDEYLLKHFVEISHSEGFLEITLPNLKNLIMKDELHVINEQQVFEAVLAWVKRSPMLRQKNLPELLTFVRMPLLGYKYLCDIAAKEKIINQFYDCSSMLNEAKAYWTKPANRALSCNFTIRHRNFTMDSATAKNHLYAMCTEQNEFRHDRTVVIQYDINADKWEMRNARTKYVKDAAIVVMRGMLYVIGGQNSIGRALDAVQMYNPERDTWSTKASLPVKLSQAAAAVYSDKIYVFGGKLAGGNASKYSLCYSLENDKWHYLSNMYEYRIGACAVAANECIYILGGHGLKEPSSSVEMYNAKTENWDKNVSPLCSKSYRFSATFINDTIFAYGNNFLEFFDIKLKEWDRVCSVPKNRYGVCVLSFQDKLYAVGGEKMTNIISSYDLQTGKWTEGQPLLNGLDIIGAGVITGH